MQKLGVSVPEPPSDGCQHKFGSGSYCGRRRLAGSNLCLWHHHSIEKYQTEVVSNYFGESLTFREAIEREVKSGASLEGAYLESAQLGGNWFKSGVDLQRADLRFANMRGAHLSYGTLLGANLAGANLELAFLSDVDLGNANLTWAKLFETKFRNNDFRQVIGLEKGCFRNWNRGLIPKYRMLESHPDQAEPMYRALVAYFATKCALEDASWAAYRYRVMHHAILRGKLSFLTCVFEDATRQVFGDEQIDLRRAFERGGSSWVASLFEFATSWVFRWISGYGEKPLRVALFSAAVIFCYAGLYDLFDVLKEAGFSNALYFSIVTFTTLGYGDLTPHSDYRLFAASEAVVGLLLSGLFLFTLSRRSVGRA